MSIIFSVFLMSNWYNLDLGYCLFKALYTAVAAVLFPMPHRSGRIFSFGCVIYLKIENSVIDCG